MFWQKPKPEPTPPPDPATPAHVDAVKTQLAATHNVLSDHLRRLEHLVRESYQAPNEVKQALKAYEQSHMVSRESTVNGFTHVEHVLCDCGLCKTARKALG